MHLFFRTLVLLNYVEMGLRFEMELYNSLISIMFHWAFQTISVKVSKFWAIVIQCVPSTR